MSTQLGAAAALRSTRDGSADLEHAVIAARRHLVDVRKRRDDANTSLTHLKQECERSRNVEDSLFRQLVECEREIYDLFRELVDTPASLMGNDGNTNNNNNNSSPSSSFSFGDSLLMQLIALRTQEEENTLRRLQDDLEASEREFSKVSKLSQVQRAEMLRLVKNVAREYRALEATSAKEESELFRMKQETQDVVARTQGNKLRIVRDLFQL